MKLFIYLFILLFAFKINACEKSEYDHEAKASSLMGKKSTFYDAYKLGKCVLDDALEPFSVEQRKLIASLIAKTYE